MGIFTECDETSLTLQLNRAGLGNDDVPPLLSFCTAAFELQARSSNNSHHYSTLILGSQLGP